MQCVILAGGLGTRIRARSADLPKALIPVLGKPFIEYQLEWLARELTTRPDKPAIIVGHHNLQAPGAVSGLKDSAALEELFAQHRQVKAYIYGHTHNWHVEPHASGVQLINLPPTGYVFKAGRPSGWVRCTLARDGAEFELRSLDTKHPEHAQVKRLEWRTT